jgi:hypothetical protein
MYVNDYELRHLGLITDRFYPDFPEVPTPYLSSECIVVVELIAEAIGEVPAPDNVTDAVTTTIAEPKATASAPVSDSLRRVSSRIHSQAQSKNAPETKEVGTRRLVRDRWYYPHPVPAFMGSSDVTDDDEQLRFTGAPEVLPPLPVIEDGPDALILGPVEGDNTFRPPIPLNRLQRHNLLKRFNAEARHRRRMFKLKLERDWEII